MAPKRNAITQDGPGDEPGPSSAPKPAKKTRFVSPSDDPSNFEAQVEDTLEDSANTRKRRVKTEGYDSDSTDDGEGVVFSRHKDDAADDDDDMFALGEDDEKKGGDDSGKKKRSREFMRLGDIEGQEFNDEDGSLSDEEEPEDEDDAERRRKEGMGYELSRFNMREEMEEGRFSADGSYVRSFDPHAMHDRWMEDFDERAIKKARRSMKKLKRVEKDKERAEAEGGLGSVEEMQKSLIGMLRKGESVLEALARLGAKAKKEKAAIKANGHGPTIGLHADPDTQTDIDRITSLASGLLVTNVDIYSETYESLLRSIRSKGNVELDWTPPKKEIKYEYRWAVGDDLEDNRQVFGPFGEEEMRGWYGAAFFGTSGENIEVREAGKGWGDWGEVMG